MFDEVVIEMMNGTKRHIPVEYYDQLLDLFKNYVGKPLDLNTVSDLQKGIGIPCYADTSARFFFYYIKESVPQIKYRTLYHYVIYYGGHEMNWYDTLQGFDLRDAIKRELHLEGVFGWAVEEGKNVEDVYNWIKNGDGAETVHVFVSTSPIEEVS